EVRESVVTGTDLILAERTNLRPMFESQADATSTVARSDERPSDDRPIFPPSRLLAPAVNRRWQLRALFLVGTAMIMIAALVYLAFFSTPKPSETKASLISARDSVALTADRFGEQHFTPNPDAYHAYLQGRYYWSQGTTPG